MNETSDQVWANRPRFSTEFPVEAQMHRRPITGSYERFDNSRERMNEYFAHQERYEGEKNTRRRGLNCVKIFFF